MYIEQADVSAVGHNLWEGIGIGLVDVVLIFMIKYGM